MKVKMILSRCSHTATTHCLGEAAAANEEVLFSHDVSSWKSGSMQILPNQDTLMTKNIILVFYRLILHPSNRPHCIFVASRVSLCPSSSF